MNEYFEKCMESTREIKKDSRLITQIKNIFDNPSHYRCLGHGNCNIIYSVGQTKSGLWVALRKPIADVGTKEESVEMYRNFCNVAQNLSYLIKKIDWNNVSRPVNFCVGVEYEHNFGLLVEDITEGEKIELFDEIALVASRKNKKGLVERIGIDLDNFEAKLAVQEAIEIYLKEKIEFNDNYLKEDTNLIKILPPSN